MTAPPPLLNVAKVAELLSMTPAAVYAAVERGELPGVVRLGQRRLRFKAEPIYRLMDRGIAPGVASLPGKSSGVAKP